MDLAVQNGAPIIGLNDSGGARIQEGVVSLAGYSKVFLRNTRASGVVPQISAILGPCAGGAVYSPAITDFVFMTEKTSYLFVTGPDVIKTVTHEEVTKEELGGSRTHSERVGGRALRARERRGGALRDPRAALLPARRTTWTSRRSREPREPPARSPRTSTGSFPRSRTSPYDMGELVRRDRRRGRFLEVHADFARNILVGFIRLAGRSSASSRISRCTWPACSTSTRPSRARASCASATRSTIPLLVFEDVPGFLPGTQQEYGGIIRHGAKLLYAFAEATVPKVSVITRKAYGGAYCVMLSKDLATDFNFAYPTAEIAVMGPEGAVNILYRSASWRTRRRGAGRRRWPSTWRTSPTRTSPPAAATSTRSSSRPRRARSSSRPFALLESKRVQLPAKKHGNIPL